MTVQVEYHFHGTNVESRRRSTAVGRLWPEASQRGPQEPNDEIAHIGRLNCPGFHTSDRYQATKALESWPIVLTECLRYRFRRLRWVLMKAPNARVPLTTATALKNMLSDKSCMTRTQRCSVLVQGILLSQDSMSLMRRSLKRAPFSIT
jgi:hypothetical protein